MQRDGSSDARGAEDMNEKRKSQFSQPEMHDSSPFNSKFTVLKFNGKSPNHPSSMSRPSPHPKYKSSGGVASADVTPVKRGLFSNATNQTPMQSFSN